MDIFDDIRPYTDTEIPEAMKRIARWDLLPQILKFIYPNMSTAEGYSRLRSLSSVSQLQSTFMDDAICRIIEETTSSFTHSGLSHLRRGKAYLFVSNHRDITLDAFLLQHLLVHHGGNTSHIVFGENLLANPVIEDLFRSNKLIRMKRSDTPRAFYESLHHLSQYLNHLIADMHQSVWIAQKNGRAKDGRDTTAPAMLKMLTLGSTQPPLQTLEAMHIVPVSVSYEWDPCDSRKAAELAKSQNGTYHKSENEDLKSVITGIIGPKGHVHLAIGQPLKAHELQPPAGVDLFEHVAATIDRHIHSNYRLMPTNHAAHDLIGNRPPSRHYTRQTLDQLKTRADSLPSPEMRRLLLEAYAAPVDARR